MEREGHNGVRVEASARIFNVYYVVKKKRVRNFTKCLSYDSAWPPQTPSAASWLSDYTINYADE